MSQPLRDAQAQIHWETLPSPHTQQDSWLAKEKERMHSVHPQRHVFIIAIIMHIFGIQNHFWSLIISQSQREAAAEGSCASAKD